MGGEVDVLAHAPRGLLPDGWIVGRQTEAVQAVFKAGADRRDPNPGLGRNAGERLRIEIVRIANVELTQSNPNAAAAAIPSAIPP